MRSLLTMLLTASLATAVPSAPAGATPATVTPEVQLTGATVLTLEGGIVGAIPGLRITRSQLQGSLCRGGNVCQGVDYLALPGDNFNEDGGKKLREAVATVPGSDPVVLFGHSQGGQVIDAALRFWDANPGKAPDPSRVSWVSIGNPDNSYGGVRAKLGTFDRNTADTDYPGIEVIRQYDGWADFPDDRTNILAVLNAVIGSQTIHPWYFDVDVNDPANVRYTPDKADGSPGNITYVLVPTKTLPLVANTGFLAPVLDSWLRPIVEAGYRRPGGAVVGASGAAEPRPAPSAAVSSAAPTAAATVSSSAVRAEVAPRALRSVGPETRPSRSAARTDGETAGADSRPAPVGRGAVGVRGATPASAVDAGTTGLT